MKYVDNDWGCLLVFDKGELLISELTRFIKEKKLVSGYIMGLGGLIWAELGFYKLTDKEYSWRRIDEPLELTNFTGNIAWHKDELVLHAHVTIADQEFRAFGGHLKEAEVAGTVELQILTDATVINRYFDEDTGLRKLAL